MDFSVIGGLVLRHVLTGAGGVGAGMGAATGSKEEMVAGLLAFALGIGMSYLNKKKPTAKKK